MWCSFRKFCCSATLYFSYFHLWLKVFQLAIEREPIGKSFRTGSFTGSREIRDKSLRRHDHTHVRRDLTKPPATKRSDRDQNRSSSGFPVVHYYQTVSYQLRRRSVERNHSNCQTIPLDPNDNQIRKAWIKLGDTHSARPSGGGVSVDILPFEELEFFDPVH